MHTRSGGRRERERSSSVVLLGKLSAIVRRGSMFQPDGEDVRSSSNSSQSSDEKKEASLDETGTKVTRAVRRCSVGAAPAYESSMTLWDPRVGSSNNKSIGRATIPWLQFYPTRPYVDTALTRPWSHEEFQRRATIEAQIGDFRVMHESMNPQLMPWKHHEILEKNDEVGNNEQENMEEEERRVAQSDEKAEEMPPRLERDELDKSAASKSSDDLLDFDPANIRSSVRKLMKRIMYESLMGELDVQFTDLSNQDGANHVDVNKIEDLEEFAINNNDDDESPTNEQEKEQIEELQPTEHRQQQPRPHQPSADSESLSSQDELTSSVRRLVIELKDDSDQLHKSLNQSHGICRKSILNPMRRRAGSCPSAYDPSASSTSSNGFTTSSPLTSSAQEMHPAKKHKKIAFLRFGPRVLQTLHLRRKRKTYLFTDEELETIEGARWKIVELAFRFGGKHRSYLVQAINMFFPLLKYGRRGGAHATRLHCNCCGTLQWQHKRGGLSEAVDLAEVLQVLNGRQTAVFRKYSSTVELEGCSFSVVFRNRTLDLETQNSSHRDWIVSALRTLIAYARRQRRIEHQAIAERALLPLEDDLLSFPAVHNPSPAAAQAYRRLNESKIIAATPPNYKLRTVY
ncbi:hypothetical protein PsorP6_004437 [Peronosclerospora sorghi]|uniref:Uncharacterized protein n=1 Tax=Peronosclerospora sorghi TaxID=230839 RepID=A0ACC0VM01_9STRA|nr:hypothetical protein PsorP6_004437 [Peronosclerospora sorghi]